MQRTRTGVVTIAMAVTLAACGGVGVEPGAGGIEHPTAADEPILIVQDTGGFVPPQYAITRVPTFVLYGDGTLVVQGPQIMIYPPPLLPPLFAVRIGEAQIQTLLEAARDAGLFADRTLDDFCGVADVATTVVTVQAQGGSYRTSVYGLGFENCQDDPQARLDISAFVEELNAIAMQDTELSGCPIAKGAMVSPLLGSANTDETAFDGADSVDFGREVNKHLAFGGGVHRCLGSHLARMELRVALEEWHKRVPDYRIPEGVELLYSQGLRQVDNLELEW